MEFSATHSVNADKDNASERQSLLLSCYIEYLRL